MLEIFVSTDIETDGPIPGINSMLSFGSAAFNQSGKLIGTFERNLDLLEGAVSDPDTMDWWKTQPKAWEICRKNTVPPKEAMDDYVKWLLALPGSPVFVGYPAGFDFLFVYWYLIRFTGISPFSFSALDIKSYAMAVLKTNFLYTTKSHMPSDWFGSHPHNHTALGDAIEQGELFMAMRKFNLDER